MCKGDLFDCNRLGMNIYQETVGGGKLNFTFLCYGLQNKMHLIVHHMSEARRQGSSRGSERTHLLTSKILHIHL